MTILKAVIPNPNHYNYPDDFKRKVAQEYLKGQKSYRVIQDEFNLPTRGLVTTWVKQYKKQQEVPLVVSFPQKEMTLEEQQDLEAVRKRNEELEKALDKAHLKISSLETMIDIAQTELNIDIRKKSGTKQ